MKKHFSAAALALLALVSCNKASSIPETPANADRESVQTGILSINVEGLPVVTKAEESLTNVELFIAEGNQEASKVVFYKNIENATTASIQLKEGTYYVYAVANARRGNQATVGAINTSVDLISNIADGEVQPVMYGASTAVTLTKEGVMATVSLKRAVSRIRLTKVTSGLTNALGSMTLKEVYLYNVPKIVKLNGTPVVNASDKAQWYHPGGFQTYGTSIATSTLVSSDKNDCAPLLYKSIGAVVAAGGEDTEIHTFYANPNTLTSETKAFSATFGATGTVMMVVATIGGTDYFYPVSLKKAIAANTSYNVALTINSKGNDAANPTQPIASGALSVSVSIADWTTGAETSEII